MLHVAPHRHRITAANDYKIKRVSVQLSRYHILHLEGKFKKKQKRYKIN